jgi:hypothetical protein
VHTHSVEDLEQLFDQHACVAGICTRRSHRQNVLLSPADVASSAAELATLIAVRDCLTERKFRMLEMEPTPRFESLTDAVEGPVRGLRPQRRHGNLEPQRTAQAAVVEGLGDRLALAASRVTRLTALEQEGILSRSRSLSRS